MPGDSSGAKPPLESLCPRGQDRRTVAAVTALTGCPDARLTAPLPMAIDRRMRSTSTNRRCRRASGLAVALALMVAASPASAVGRGGRLPTIRRVTWMRAEASAAPEIDPGTARSVVAILVGGLAILRDRRSRR